MNALHSMVSPEWYTPSAIVEAAREVMGRIDLDPASCAQANEVVKATTYFTKEQNGLSMAAVWAGRVFLNPPGGRGLVPAFWERLLYEYQAARVSHAIWVGYSLEQLQTLQACALGSPLDFSICFTSKRVRFVSPTGAKNSPTHSNYIAYLAGPRPERSFAAVFSRFGKVVVR